MVEADEINPGLKPADPFFEQEMVNLEGLDIEMELASFLGDDNGWDAGNILDNIGSPLSLPHADSDEPNSTTEEQRQKDLDSSTFKTFTTNEIMEPILEKTAALICDPKFNVSINATQNKVQTTIEPAYNKGNSSSCENQLLAPTPIVDVPNSTLPHHHSLPLSNCSASPSPVGLISQIAGSSIKDKYMAHMGCFCQFSHMQNDNNSNIHGVLGMPNQQSINSHPVLMPSIIMGSNNFSGINSLHHPPPYPALCYIYPIQIQAGVGVGVGIGTGQSSGQFITNQRDASLQNNITHHTPQISGRPGSNQFPSPNVYGSHYAPNNMQQHESSTSYRQVNPFTPPLLHQDGHGFGMQKIYDLQSQNYLQAAYPTYPNNNKPQQEAHLQYPASVVQVAPNNHSHHQHGCNNSRPNAFVIVPPPNPRAHQYYAYNNSTPLLPDPPIPSLYHPMRYDNHYNNLQAVTMPGVRWQQGVGSLQLKVSQGVPVQMNDYKRLLLNTPNNNNVKRQSHRLHKPSSVPQAVWSRNLQAGGTTRTPIPDEGSSSQGSNSSPPHHYARLISLLRPEKESGGVGKEQVTPISTNNLVTNQRYKGKGKLPDSSSTSREPSEAIRRILDMNPRRTVTRNPQQNPETNLSSGRVQGSIQEGWNADHKIQLASKGPLKLTDVAGQEQNKEKPRRARGRPPKRRGPIELSSSSKLRILESGPPPEQAADDETHQNEVQSANPTGRPTPPSASSELSNGIYDMAYAKIGLPVDPFLRFQAILEK